MTNSKFYILLIFLGVTLTACGAAFSPDGSVWIDQPLNGTTLPHLVNDPDILVHASFPAGVEAIYIQWDHYLNGNLQKAMGPEDWISGQTPPNYLSFSLLQEINPGLFSQQLQIEGDGPGLYVVRVRAEDKDGNMGEIAQVEFQICTELENALSGLCLPQAAELGTNTPVPVTPAPIDLTLVAIPSQNANCRLGPSATYFDIDDTLIMNTEYSPLAQGPDANWLLFEGPASQNRCWVFIGNLDLFCGEVPVQIADISPCTLSVENYPATPTMTPTPTFTPEPEGPTATPRPQCSDGIDNDGDGDIDLADGRCTSPSDNDENS